MLDKLFNKGRGQADRSRAVFILIALAGILPSALVLWFASLAVRNEQLATTQVEEETRQVLLTQIKSDLAQGWNELLEQTDKRIAGLPPAVAFFETVIGGNADGLIIYTANDTHRVAYPGLPTPADKSTLSTGMLSAGAVLGDSASPSRVHKQEKDLNTQLASQFSVLTAAIQKREKDKAESAARTILANAEYAQCVDSSGRHSLSSVELYILENRDVLSKSTYESALSRLTARLNDYRFELIPTSQRRFLMNRIVELTSQAPTSATLFPTLSAEFLSAQFMETNYESTTGSYLSRSALEHVWQQRLPTGRGIALFTDDRIRKVMGDRLAAMANPLAKLVRIEGDAESSPRPSADATVLLGDAFPGWRLRIVDANTNSHGTSLSRIYVALSVASVALILFILILIASITLRRLALAQQKNTMVATVSHELKTPVSSIKLLVDTLLQDKVMRTDRVREYLDLISRENLRLSQLIENFLSFSRIERTKFKIERQQLDVAALIREAVATFSRQADLPNQELTVEIAPGIPPYSGDAWALNRVLLNLLDNAYKYSEPPRQILVAARVEQRSLVIAVSDKGIGIRDSDLTKIFTQFYQADQRLSRSNEGCGLGLSIVEHVVHLHGGTVDVNSTLGIGSTFTVRLPLE